MKPPRVTVLMTTYNGAATIGASIDSVLRQSMPDFELVVVDDGSTDRTAEILAGIGDARLRVLRAARNGGIVAARNLGFAAARGDYVAALDHDDLSHPDRLLRQAEFLDAHPEIVLLATEIEIERDGRLSAPDHPRANDGAALRWLLMIDNPFTWSSIMVRADAARRLGGFLRPERALADDFDFYHRLVRLGEVARLPEVLTTYRYHAGNASIAQADLLRAHTELILQEAYAPWLGDEAARAAALVTRHLCEREPIRDAATLDQLGDVLARLLEGFTTAHALDGTERARVASLAGDAWRRAVRSTVRAGAPTAIGRLRRGDLASGLGLTLRDLASSVAVGCVRAVLR